MAPICQYNIMQSARHFGLGSAGISSLSKILGYLEKGFERYIRNCLDLFPQIKLNISSCMSLHHEENFPKFCSIFCYQCLSYLIPVL
jgi:hypothetical protein